MRSIVLVALFLLVAVASLYCASAGWVSAELTAALQENKAPLPSTPIVYDGLEWVNGAALQRYKAVQTAEKYFPWIVGIPQPLALVLTALAFGALGGTVRVAHDLVAAKSRLEGHHFAVLGLSALMGLFVLGVTYVIPAALTVSEASVKPAALLFFSSIGGAFYDHIFKWSRAQVKKIFSGGEP